MSKYFDELAIKVNKWDELFDEMDHDPHGSTYAYLRLSVSGEAIGFIQFTAMEARSCFFRPSSALSANSGSHKPIEAADTAKPFYIKNGYMQMDDVTAKNNAPVLVKILTD